MSMPSCFIACTSIVPGDGAAERRRVEVGGAGRGDVEGTRTERCETFGDELLPAVDEARRLGAVGERPAGDVVVVGLVRLAEMGGVGRRDGALVAHPEQRGARVEPAREGDADAFAGREGRKDGRHGSRLSRPSLGSAGSASGSRAAPAACPRPLSG
jgi:hypothetical protein